MVTWALARTDRLQQKILQLILELKFQKTNYEFSIYVCTNFRNKNQKIFSQLQTMQSSVNSIYLRLTVQSKLIDMIYRYFLRWNLGFNLFLQCLNLRAFKYLADCFLIDYCPVIDTLNGFLQYNGKIYFKEFIYLSKSPIMLVTIAPRDHIHTCMDPGAKANIYATGKKRKT